MKTDEIINFFENRKCCIKAASPLKFDATVGLTVRDSKAKTQFIFKRTPEGNRLLYWDSAEKVDFSFNVPTTILKKIIYAPTEDIGELGVLVLRHMISQMEEDEKIIPEMHISFFLAVRRGYIGVLALGGKSLLSFMAQHGISLSTLKSALQRIRA